MNLYEAVNKNKYGFYELKEKYRRYMNTFYENEYYQNDTSIYHKVEYDLDDLKYKMNLYAEKENIFIHETNIVHGTFLDLCCGEGYALSFFKKKGWDVTGIDLSDAGIKAHNPEMYPYFIKGNCLTEIDRLRDIGKAFDFINADNALEHLPDPLEFLQKLKSICTTKTIICIKVPNDFSIIQKLAWDNEYIDTPFWVTTETSEHLNYFSLKSLTKFGEMNGYKRIRAIADWPIDFCLINPKTNYIRLGEGHECYIAKIKIENKMFEESMVNTIKLHEALAELGVGRNISVFFKLNDFCIL